MRTTSYHGPSLAPHPGAGVVRAAVGQLPVAQPAVPHAAFAAGLLQGQPLHGSRVRQHQLLHGAVIPLHTIGACRGGGGGSRVAVGKEALQAVASHSTSGSSCISCL